MGWGLSTGQVKISSVAKKNKKNQDLPEGMSRRQAKLAARAAERAKLQRTPVRTRASVESHHRAAGVRAFRPRESR